MSSVGTLPSARSQPNTGGGVQLPRVEPGAQPVGQAARHVARQAAAGDVGQPLDRAGAADRRQQRLHVDARRLEQRLSMS